MICDRLVVVQVELMQFAAPRSSEESTEGPPQICCSRSKRQKTQVVDKVVDRSSDTVPAPTMGLTSRREGDHHRQDNQNVSDSLPSNAHAYSLTFQLNPFPNCPINISSSHLDPLADLSAYPSSISYPGPSTIPSDVASASANSSQLHPYLSIIF